MPASRIKFRAWPRGLLAPNLYVSGETHYSTLPTVPHWVNVHPFLETSPPHHSFPSCFQGNNPTCPAPPLPGPCCRVGRTDLFSEPCELKLEAMRCQVIGGCAKMLMDLVSSHAPGSEKARGMLLDRWLGRPSYGPGLGVVRVCLSFWRVLSLFLPFVP